MYILTYLQSVFYKIRCAFISLKEIFYYTPNFYSKSNFLFFKGFDLGGLPVCGIVQISLGGKVHSFSAKTELV